MAKIRGTNLPKRGRVKDDLLFTLFGLGLILIALLSWTNALMNLDSANPLWFCYIAVFFIGIGIMTKNSTLILTQVNLIAIPLLFWDIDFFWQLITGRTLWGVTDYFFIVGWLNSLGNFLTLQHIYIVPVALGFVYLLRVKRKDLWKFTILEAIAIFILSLLFSSREANANCAFTSCIDFVTFTGIGYQAFWLAAVALMIFLTNFVVIWAAKKLGRFKAQDNK